MLIPTFKFQKTYTTRILSRRCVMTLVTVGNFKRLSISEHMPQAKTAAAARILGLYHPYPLSNCCNLDSPLRRQPSHFSLFAFIVSTSTAWASFLLSNLIASSNHIKPSRCQNKPTHARKTFNFSNSLPFVLGAESGKNRKRSRQGWHTWSTQIRP